MKRKVFLAGLLALVLVAGHSRIRPATVANAQGDATSEILRLVNQVRAGYGLPPFQWDAALASAAQVQANYMATNNIYSHTGAGGSTPQSRALAAGYNGYATENIVGGTDLTPSQGVVWWQNSAIHFNTMISRRYIHAGVGFAQGHDQNFYTLVAGVPSNSVGAEEVAGAPLADDAALAPVAPIQIAAPREDGSVVHVVGPGQSFWAIAARYEVTLDQLYLYNNLTEDSVINPGDELLIRLAEGQAPPPTPTPPATHKVRAGESLWTIAAWYKLSLDEILWLNGMQEDSLLSPGDEVRIRLLPGEEPPPTATPQVAHVVQRGDTAWAIALRYGLSVDELLAYNQMDTSRVLSIGDTLLVVSPTPIPTATPEPTATLPATATPVPSPTPQPTPAPDTAARSAKTAVPTPTPAPLGMLGQAGGGSVAFGLGLLVFAGVAIVLYVRQGK